MHQYMRRRELKIDLCNPVQGCVVAEQNQW
jgi:hypothetical protein